MADTPAEAASTNGGSSFFQGKKRMPKESFHAYLFSAIVVDLLFFWLPGAGTAFVGFCYGKWWLEGYDIDKIGMKALGSAIAGLFPIIEDFATIYFVVSGYADNVKNTTVTGAAASAVQGELKNKDGGKGIERNGKNEMAQNKEETKAQKNRDQKKSGEFDNRTPFGKDKNVDGVARNFDKPQDGRFTAKTERNLGTVGKDMTAVQANQLLDSDREQRRQSAESGIPANDNSVDGIVSPGKNTGGAGTGYTPRRPEFYKPAPNEKRPPLSEQLPLGKDKQKESAVRNRVGEGSAASPAAANDYARGKIQEEMPGGSRHQATPPQFIPRDAQSGGEEGVEQNRSRDRDTLPLQDAPLEGVARAGGSNQTRESLAPGDANEARRILAEENLPPAEAREIQQILREKNITTEQKLKIEVVIKEHQFKVVPQNKTIKIQTTEIKPTAETYTEIKTAA